MILAVLDSGIPLQNNQLSHPDLSDAQRFHLGRDFINNDDDPADDHGHGTHVAGIAAAQVDNQVGVAGLAWNTQVLVVKVFDNKLDGSNEAFMNGVLSAVEYAEKSGRRLVINYSGGGPPGDLKHDAVQHAHDSGALLVAAVGNQYGSSIRYPAAYSADFPGVIAVGAVNRNRERADFSNRGPEMTVVAPGVDILSTMPDYYVTANANGKQMKYDRWEGTSMATPFVAALAVLVWSKSPGMTAAQVRQKLTDTTDNLPGDPQDVGSGIINARKALV
ncbi:MAG: S8 family serine peptidase [Candidatus Acidiferrales bacterium]